MICLCICSHRLHTDLSHRNLILLCNFFHSVCTHQSQTCCVPLRLFPQVGSARHAAGVHAALRCAGRLDAEVRLPTPGANARAAMLADGLDARRGVEGPGAAALARVAARAEGCDASDVRVLLDRALHVATARTLHALNSTAPHAVMARTLRGPDSTALHVRVTEADLLCALGGFVPAAFWSVPAAGGAAADGGPVGWDDVGGLSDVRGALDEGTSAWELPVRAPHVFLVRITHVR